MNMIDKYKACLIGGAIGDALGYAVEFKSEPEIFSQYGESGITDYKLRNGKAIVSDDTQMTLFTADGMIRGYYTGSYTDSVYNSYKEWYMTQALPMQKNNYRSWLMKIPELWNRRSPGFTCISAITSGKKGSIRNPINDSKGCGGIMRTAPIGLFFRNTIMIAQTDILAAETSAITHGHELGYIPSAAFAHIINLISHSDISLKDAIMNSISYTKKTF